MTESVDRILVDANQRMDKAVQSLSNELGTIRTGRATPALVEHIQVDYYEVPTPINQLASISIPDARLLIIQPWDRQAIKAIEKKLQQSALGLTQANDGTTIRLTIPPLSEERRRELVRLVRRKIEDGRIAARNVRRDALDKLRQTEKNKESSEDTIHRAQERLQKQTDTHVVEMDHLGARKETEVMEV